MLKIWAYSWMFNQNKMLNPPGRRTHVCVCKLTHWDRAMRICVSKLTTIVSDNGLSPDRHQIIIWTNSWILLIEPLGTNFSEILSDIHIYLHSRKRVWKCRLRNGDHFLGRNVLSHHWLRKWLGSRRGWVGGRGGGWVVWVGWDLTWIQRWVVMYTPLVDYWASAAWKGHSLSPDSPEISAYQRSGWFNLIQIAG